MFYKLDYNNDSHCIAISECVLEWARAGDSDLRNTTLWELIDDLVSNVDDVTLRDAAEVILNTIGAKSILPDRECGDIEAAYDPRGKCQ